MPLLRRANLGDAKLLATLAERTFRATFAASNSANDMDQFCLTHYSEQFQCNEINNLSTKTFVIEEQQNLVAFMQLRQAPPPSCITDPIAIEIQRLYVDQPWHGQGLAQQLMDEACVTAVQWSATALWLGVWERNPRAIHFYNKCGFIEVGEHVFTLGSDLQRDIIMKKPL